MACDFRLEVFMTLCRTGSFTKTADALGVSQPAVSQNIAELEKDLGVKLFTRSRGEISLTSEGVLFRGHAERILYWYESARSAFRAGKISAGPIAVQCTPDLSSIVSGLFARLRHSFPDLAFVSRSYRSGSQSPDDAEENILGLYSYVGGFSQHGASETAGDILLYTAGPVLAVSPLSRYLRDFPPAGTGIDFNSYPRLSVLSYGRAVQDELAAAGLSGKIVFTSDSAEAVKDLARMDPDVAAVLPPYCVRTELSDGRLAQLPSSWLDFRYSVYMHLPGNLPEHEDIVRILREMLSSGL